MEETIVDARNTKCPMPIIQISKAVKLLSAGSILKVLANDPVFKPDVTAWCKQTKNELLSFEDNDGFFTATIKVCK